MAKEDPDKLWLNAEDIPGHGSVYGGLVELPDGRFASVYLQLEGFDIGILEATIIAIRHFTESGLEKTEYETTDTLLTEEELGVVIEANNRHLSLRRYIYEEVVPFYYNRKSKDQ